MKKNNKGFTLAELLIVVAIIAVLVMIAIPVFSNSLEKSKEATDLANIRSTYSEVLTGAIADGTSTGVVSSSPIELKQGKSEWQSANNVLASLGTEVGTPSAGGYVIVEYHPEEKDEIKAVVFRYTDDAGEFAETVVEEAINYASSQSVGKYVLSQVQNQLNDVVDKVNEDEDYKKVFNSKSDTGIAKTMTLGNGQEVNVIVYSRNYDTFQYVSDRFKTDNTATIIYNRETKKLSTIIYYDGANYSSWSVDTDYDNWSADDNWLADSYASKN